MNLPLTLPPLKIIRFLVALFATSAVAQAWDVGNPDLPAGNSTFNGNGSRTTGIVHTYNIPLTDHPESLHFIVRGGDGGNADAGPVSNRDKFQGKGGGGALATATFSISSTAANALRPGGEIRVIVGNRGAHKQGVAGGTKVAAGGGGGSGVIYKGPEVNADWTPLVIAGAGGGGMTSSYSTLVLRSHGGHGQIGPIGSAPGSVFPLPGNAGQSILDGGEGGAGWLQSAYYGAGKGEPNGGAGGASRFLDLTSSGGFGCGGGGGAGGGKDGIFRYVCGGGGGGASGGGGGNNSQAGGGGGSIIDVRAIDDDTQTLVQRAGGAQLNGYIEIQPSPITIPDANAIPTISLNGGNPHDVIFSTSNAFVEPGVTATDFYNNPIAVQTISNTVNRAVSGQYQVVYETTDQYGQTTQKTRAVNVLAGSLRPTFDLLPSLIVAPTGSQSHSVISGFNAGWLGGGNSEQLVRYEITGNSNPTLFATAPGLSNSGDLSFAPKDNTLGAASLTIIAIDNGPDLSVVQSLPVQITITVTIAPEPPQFILGTDPLSYGTSLDFREDAASLVVGTVISAAPESSPDLTYSLSGVDADKFTLGESDGVLTFKTRPNYEVPTDDGSNRIYDITVTTEDGVNSVPADLTIHLLSAPPATFIVTNDANTGAGSLREVIAQANNKAGPDIIAFDPTFFDVARTITLTSGHLVVNSSITINGPSVNLLTIDGNGLNRFLAIKSGVVVVNDLTVTNSAASAQTFIPPSTLIDAAKGGAIYNAGNLTLNRVTITNSIAFPSAIGTVVSRGGAIYNTGTLTVNECTLSNNVAEGSTANNADSTTVAQGGAIFNLAGGVVLISDSILTGNQALGYFAANITGQPDNWAIGGAIYNLGDLTLDNTTVSSNLSQALSDWVEGMDTRAWAGGVYNDGTLEVRNGCVFSDNSALADTNDIGPAKARGGGIYSDDGSTISITDTSFSGNSAEIHNNTGGFALGGGIFNRASGSTIFRDCSFSGNGVLADSSGDTNAFGGGIYSATSLSVLGSSFFENSADATASGGTATANGGGIYTNGLTLSNSSLVANRCAVDGSLATAGGGALFITSGAATVGNSTIALNECHATALSFAVATGGGVSLGQNGFFNSGNTLVAGNTVTGGAETTVGPDVYGAMTSAGFNLIGDPSDASGLVVSDLSNFSPLAIFVDTSGNGVIDSADFQDHGGSSPTLALLSGGTATDAGNNTLIPIDPDTATAFATDQRGTGFDRIVNGTVDIGAFEVQPTTPYENWIMAYFPGVNDPAIIGLDANPSGDGLSNIQKFAFGLNPTISDTRRLKITDATTFTNGQPVGHPSDTPFNFSARFVRLKEHLAIGMIYTVEFSSDLSVWEVSNVSPTVISDDGGDYELVEVPRPFSVNGSETSFFRVGVSDKP